MIRASWKSHWRHSSTVRSTIGSTTTSQVWSTMVLSCRLLRKILHSHAEITSSGKGSDAFPPQLFPFLQSQPCKWVLPHQIVSRETSLIHHPPLALPHHASASQRNTELVGVNSSRTVRMISRVYSRFGQEKSEKFRVVKPQTTA